MKPRPTEPVVRPWAGPPRARPVPSPRRCSSSWSPSKRIRPARGRSSRIYASGTAASRTRAAATPS
jgi:hypothetical protein